MFFLADFHRTDMNCNKQIFTTQIYGPLGTYAPTLAYYKVLLANKLKSATVARSTPDRKVIRSNRVWFNTIACYRREYFYFYFFFFLISFLYVLLRFTLKPVVFNVNFHYAIFLKGVRGEIL
jgi:hypothetical protein